MEQLVERLVKNLNQSMAEAGIHFEKGFHYDKTVQYYESNAIPHDTYLGHIGSIVEAIYKDKAFRLNAILYHLVGNSHDEYWVRVYDVFEMGLWKPFFEKESQQERSLYDDKPIINKHETFEEFELEEWTEWHSGMDGICMSGEEPYREIYIEFEKTRVHLRIGYRCARKVTDKGSVIDNDHEVLGMIIFVPAD